MSAKLKLIFLLCLLTVNFSQSQSNFNLLDERSEKIKFKLIDNLIVIPVEVNGVELSFLLDTGVSKPILFNIVNLEDSLRINKVESIFLQGLGGGESIEALKSQKNLVRIGDAINVNQDLYVILDEAINFTPRLGVPIHGIIGYDLLKDFVVELNYSRKYIRLHYPEYFTYKNCKNCETFNLSFYNNKPYIDGSVGIREKDIPIKLLIDTGGSDALWLFEDEQLGISLEDEPFFQDFLGLGLSGSVYGRRSKVRSFNLKSFQFKNVNVAFPDSSSIKDARRFKDRNGSISGELLKRFNMIIDYRGGKITLEKNGMFNNPFEYNKSGIILQQEGIRVVKEKNILRLFPSSYGRRENTTNTQEIEIISSFNYVLKPAIVIAEIREGSPAEKCGLMVGDMVISVNNDNTATLKLQEILANFYGKDGKKVFMVVERNGLLMKFKFELEDVFKQKDLQN